MKNNDDENLSSWQFALIIVLAMLAAHALQVFVTFNAGRSQVALLRN